jgi:aspartyl-tRNA(Asn)/glutamyl-tRNA(Gln) amidotransferase subunit A
VPEVVEAVDLSAVLVRAEAYAQWHKVIEAAPDKMFARIRERFLSGAGITAAEYIQGWARLREVRAAWVAKTAEYDAVIVPTAPILPPHAQRLMTDEAYYVSENLLALRNTRMANMLGVCAITLPTSQPSCGISLMGPPMGEERLLRLAAAAERALG